MIRLDVGFSARSGDDLRGSFDRPPLSSMPVKYLTVDPDLLIAATAEAAQLTVLHVEKDYELIAGLTGQPVERLALA